MLQRLVLMPERFQLLQLLPPGLEHHCNVAKTPRPQLAPAVVGALLLLLLLLLLLFLLLLLVVAHCKKRLLLERRLLQQQCAGQLLQAGHCFPALLLLPQQLLLLLLPLVPAFPDDFLWQADLFALLLLLLLQAADRHAMTSQEALG
jgi:hypothetical protein